MRPCAAATPAGCFEYVPRRPIRKTNKRLLENHELGVKSQRAGQCRPTLLLVGGLCWSQVPDAGEPRCGKHDVQPAFDFVLGEVAAEPQRQCNVLSQGEILQ